MNQTKHSFMALGLVLIQILQPTIPALAAESAESTSAMSYETILDLMTTDASSESYSDADPSAAASPAPISPASQSLFNSLKKQRTTVQGLITKVGQSIMDEGKPNQPVGYTTGPYMGPGMGGVTPVYASPKPKKVYDAKSPEIVAAYQSAKDNSASLKKIIANPEVPALERFQLLRAFLTDQILPLRELTQVLGDKAPTWANRDFFELLIPTIPAEMLAKDALLNPERAKEMLDIYGYDARACQPGTEKEGDIALSFDPQYWLTQDAQAVAHAPTADRYARSLQLTTMALILAQLQHHKQILKDGSPIQVPDACRKKISDELPKNIEVTELDELDWEARMDALMEANGLSALSPEYQHVFATQDIGDPRSKGFLGYSPFEKVQAADAALNFKMVAGGPREPAIEDIDAYGEVLSLRGDKVFKHLGKYLEDSEGDPDPKKISQASQKFFALEDDIRTIGAVPPALIKRMDRAGASDWREVVPADLKKKMQETEVLLPFPPARSPQAYRKWAGQTIQSTLDQDILPRLRKIKDKKYRQLGEEDQKLINDLQYAYVNVGNFDPATLTTYFESLSKRLKSSRMNERTEGDALGKFSDADLKLWDSELTGVWYVLRQRGRIPEARINEWELMGSQMGSNPFAGVRLTMLLELRDAEKAGNSDKVKGLQKAMEDLGIQQPTVPYQSNATLTSKEKTELWRTLRDRHDEENGNLFKAQAQGINPALTYYDVLGGLASKRVLSAGDAKRAATSCLAPSKMPAYQKQASEVLESDVGQRAELLQQIYRARGNPKLQNELYQKYAAEYELMDESEAGVEARSSILELDAQLKKPLYHSVIREASLKKKADLIKGLNDLCNLDPNDHEKFKQLVYSTMKAQDLLNQQLGMKSLPPSVQKELDKLSATDKKELKLSGLALALFIGSTLILTLSTGGAGAALAPAIASGLSMASGAMVIGSVGISAVALPKMWLDEIPEAEARLKYVQAFEDLRLTNEQSVDKMKGEISSMKTWGVGANIVFAIPMVKPAAIAVAASTRATSTLIRATKPGLQAAERAAIRATARQAQQETDAIAAEYLFGYRKLTMDLLRPSALTARILEETTQPIKLTVQSADQVVGDSAKLYAQFFKNDANKMEGFLKTLKSRIARSAARDAGSGPNFLRKRALQRKEMTKVADELLEALKHDDLTTVLTKYNTQFSELVEQIPRGGVDWLATFTIEGVPGLNTPLLRLKELQMGRDALLKQLGRTELVSGAATMTARQAATRALVSEFREDILAEGSGGKARWNKIRTELQTSLKLDSPEIVDELIKYGEIPGGKGSAGIPDEALQTPAVRAMLEDLEKKTRNYQNLAEFDQWLAAKRLLSRAGG